MAGSRRSRPLALARADREGNLAESQAISDPSSEWRAYACMTPFTASDSTPLLMLYGGTNGTADTDPLSAAARGMNDLQVFDINGARWYAPATANTPKTGPVLPGCGAASGSIWVYDPHYGVPNSTSTVVGLLDSVHWSWSSPTGQGQLPVTRFGAAFAYVPDRQAFYMHGGIALSGSANTADSQSGTVNNLDILSPQDLSWSYASNGPARKYHTLCYMSAIDAAVLFGGSDSNMPSYNDIKLLYTKTNTWSYSPSVSGDAPAARILHSAVCSKDSMYVFGGRHSTADEPSDSTVWVLKADSAESFTWSKAPISSKAQKTGPTARAGHSAALYQDSMYIFGGIGPSGQDSIMYKLDLGSWEWLQTSAAGSNAGTQDGKSRTAVIIAAIVSSVLGIVVVGIAATVVYRLVRRRYGAFPLPGRTRSGTQSSLSSAGPGGSPTVSEHEYKGTVGRRDSMPLGAGGGSPATADSQAIIVTESATRSQPAAAGAPDMAASGTRSRAAGLAEGNGIEELDGTSAMTTPVSVATDLPLSPAGKGSPVSSRWPIADSMWERARTLSQRVASVRAPMLSSDGLETTAATGDRRRADTTRRSPRRHRPGVASQYAAEMGMYGSDYARTENEYRHAEAINEILLSGQPIPSWLRDAVNQAQSTVSGEHQSGTQLAAAAAAPGRQPLSVANPAPRQSDDG
ncbi:hypothetical protein LPJ61_000133 [Coemansia biformis]|uniref:Galactose oxidase n=1 Tax=Coemansia biformis TaxID=1286918 RepID=A0A9W8D0T5_9FUNG|nr:hypothetical protein LPJ61_000133 [Coemansia biformis]